MGGNNSSQVHDRPINAEIYGDDEPVLKPGDEKITVGLVKDYIALERKLRVLENANVFKDYQDSVLHLATVTKHHKENVSKVLAQERKVAKEKDDVDELWKTSSTYVSEHTEELTKEQKEYLDALNVLELAKADEKQAKDRVEEEQQKVATLKKSVDELKSLYASQDQLLVTVFGGSYGSVRENELESHFDKLSEYYRRIVATKTRWQNAKGLAETASQQFLLAEKTWREDVSWKDMNKSYEAVDIVRKNLTAGLQNIGNAQDYLGNVEFPFCTKSDRLAVWKATEHIFNDMTKTDRKEHALGCYTSMADSSHKLVDWMDQVIDETIDHDEQTVGADTEKVESELQAERLRLLGEKIKEKSGEEFDVTELLRQLEQIRNQRIAKGQAAQIKANNTKDHLGPKLSSQQVFGMNMEEARSSLSKQAEAMERRHQFNDQRVTDDLEQRLAARKTRRQRLAAAEEK